jgi:ADP-ribosylglycohydrolase
VGDAFGSALNARTFDAPAFPRLAAGPHVELEGAGTFREESKLKPGQVTEVTQLACCLGWSLRLMKVYDREDAARRYIEWLPNWPDASPEVKPALELLQQKRYPELVGKPLWDESARTQAGNGVLARVVPIGVHFATKQVERSRASYEDCSLTHYDPRCQLGCVAVTAAIAKAVSGGAGVTAKDMAEAARSEIALTAPTLAKQDKDLVRYVYDAGEELKKDLELAQTDDPELYGPQMHLNTQRGFVRVTFRLAFWELFHAPDFETGLIDAVNRGGDASINGAVAGALLGALHEGWKIPERWRKTVLGALGSGAGSGGPLWETYHPRHLLPLVED